MRPPDEFFPLEEFRRCANSALGAAKAGAFFQLGPSGRIPSAEAGTGRLAPHGWIPNRTAEQLLITDGCQQAIDLVCKAFLRPGDAVADRKSRLPRRAVHFHRARTRMLGVAGGHRTGRNRHTRLDIFAIETVLMQNRVKLIFLTPDYHNPTGTILPIAERRRLLELAARFQVPMIEDSIYARLHSRDGDAVAKTLDRPQPHPD